MVLNCFFTTCFYDNLDLLQQAFPQVCCQWVALDNIQVDLAKGQISGEATHFTRFAVLAVPKTGQTVEPPRPSLNVPAYLTNHWARDSVMKLLEAGIVSGYRDGTFQPDRTVTRAVQVENSVGTVNFTDSGQVGSIRRSSSSQ